MTLTVRSVVTVLHMLKTALNNVLLPTLFNVVNNIVQSEFNIVESELAYNQV